VGRERRVVQLPARDLGRPGALVGRGRQSSDGVAEQLEHLPPLAVAGAERGQYALQGWALRLDDPAVLQALKVAGPQFRLGFDPELGAPGRLAKRAQAGAARGA